MQTIWAIFRFVAVLAALLFPQLASAGQLAPKAETRVRAIDIVVETSLKATSLCAGETRSVEAEFAAEVASRCSIAPRGGANLSDELLRSGDQARRRLRKELGLGRGDADEAHHLIPLSVRDHDIVKAAATEGFDFNGAMNGMPLSFDRHRGVNIFHHNKYNAAIRKRLDYEQALNPNMTPKQAAELLEAYTSKLRAGISRSKGRLK